LILDVMWGVRKTQMLALRWRNIDLEKGLVTFPPETTKGGREQIIPFGPLAREILEARRARTGKTSLDGTLAKPKSEPVLPTGEDDWVFISTKLSKKEDTFKRHTHIVEVRHVLDSAGDEAGLGITSHDLRRTFGSITFLHTGSVQAVAAALSHSTGMATTEGYIQTIARVEESRPRFLILEHVIGTMIGLPRFSQSIADQSPAASVPVSTPRKKRSSAREAELEAIAEAALRDPRLRDTFLYLAKNAKP
jgi:integrase